MAGSSMSPSPASLEAATRIVTCRSPAIARRTRTFPTRPRRRRSCPRRGGTWRSRLDRPSRDLPLTAFCLSLGTYTVAVVFTGTAIFRLNLSPRISQSLRIVPYMDSCSARTHFTSPSSCGLMMMCLKPTASGSGIDAGQDLVEPGADVAEHDVVARGVAVPLLPERGRALLEPAAPARVVGLGGHAVDDVGPAAGGQAVDQVLGPEDAGVEMAVLRLDHLDELAQDLGPLLAGGTRPW